MDIFLVLKLLLICAALNSPLPSHTLGEKTRNQKTANALLTHFADADGHAKKPKPHQTIGQTIVYGIEEQRLSQTITSTDFVN